MRVVGVVGWSALGWRCRGRCWVSDMICRRPRYRAAAHVVRPCGHPLSPPVVAGSKALGHQGAGGIPLLASARCPCAACAVGHSRTALPWLVGATPCAGRCDRRPGRVPFVPGSHSARGTLPATGWCAGWRLEIHHMGGVLLPLFLRVQNRVLVAILLSFSLVGPIPASEGFHVGGHVHSVASLDLLVPELVADFPQAGGRSNRLQQELGAQ